jgi:hypothetical protein
MMAVVHASAIFDRAALGAKGRNRARHIAVAPLRHGTKAALRQMSREVTRVRSRGVARR